MGQDEGIIVLISSIDIGSVLGLTKHILRVAGFNEGSHYSNHRSIECSIPA